MRKVVLYIVMVMLFVACGNDDGPPPMPEGAVLVFPFENSECTTGIDVNQNLSQVTFEWMAAENTNLYTLTVINLNTNEPQAITTSSTLAALSIEKGAPFSWSVISSNNVSDITAVSDNWLFYNAGAQTTYAPFPARLIGPKSGGTAIKNDADEISLEWIGADVEDDIARFEVYFSEQNPPEELLATTDSGMQKTNVAVTSGVTYYWKVITVDSEGNTSDSGVFDFRVF